MAIRQGIEIVGCCQVRIKFKSLIAQLGNFFPLLLLSPLPDNLGPVCRVKRLKSREKREESGGDPRGKGNSRICPWPYPTSPAVWSRPGIVSWHKICVIFTTRAEEDGTMSRQKSISRCEIAADLIEIKKG